MRNKPSKKSMPELCFYSMQSPDFGKRQNIWVAVSVVLFFVLSLFFSTLGTMVGIGVAAAAIQGLIQQKKQDEERRSRLCFTPYGVRIQDPSAEKYVPRFLSWWEIDDIQLFGTAFGQRWMLYVRIRYIGEKVGVHRICYLYDDMEPLAEKCKAAQQWIAYYKNSMVTLRGE